MFVFIIIMMILLFDLQLCFMNYDCVITGCDCINMSRMYFLNNLFMKVHRKVAQHSYINS